MRAFTGLEDVEAARERLVELRVRRDRARERLGELEAAAAPAVNRRASGDWDSLTARGTARADPRRRLGSDRRPRPRPRPVTVKARGE